MSMSVNLHTKHAKEFNVGSKLESGSDGVYALIKIESQPENSWEFQNVTFFSSFEHTKQLHKELSKLMKEIAAVEKANKQQKELV